MASRQWRNYLAWFAVAFAVLEVATVVLIGVPPVIGFASAGLFVLALYWLRRGGLGGVMAVGALCLLEAVAVLFFVRPTTLHVVLQAMGVVLGVTGAAVAVFALRAGRVESSSKAA